ncbi:conserved hypothetical protein [Neospora caninum Liverpool]|uniref:Uncharacterized protein n=1 Tax=Neospora caninum (strain Liverpool) TaxID=572307 RepID=F0VBW7_NEOCL|nr:conserved hypothetical protein [Neospora caninum Liverpool]CBZ51101.1 conserved hypothetical protein [Neospora caninum Liverpool]CEL68408.1 TPA: hypothetical protein BN1204_041760 [Neospora caninum Liverpool]|eukprot:XP_003881134.1 conserved hypothetical protein [Neospora caninum Liverpool]
MEAGESAPSSSSSSSSSSSPSSSSSCATGCSSLREGVAVHPSQVAKAAADVEMTDLSPLPSSSSSLPAACASAPGSYGSSVSEEQAESGGSEPHCAGATADKQASLANRRDVSSSSSSDEESDEEDAGELSPERRHAAKMRALQVALQKELVIDGDAEIDDLLVAAHVAQIENQLLEAQQKAGNLRKETIEKLLSSGKNTSLAESAANVGSAEPEKHKESKMNDEGEDDDDDDQDDQEFEALMKTEERFRQRLLPHPNAAPSVAEALMRAKSPSSASPSASLASNGLRADARASSDLADGGASSPTVSASTVVGEAGAGKEDACSAIGNGEKESYADKLNGLLALIGKEAEDEEIDEDEEDGEDTPKGKDGDSLGMWTGIHPIEVEGLPVQVAADCAVQACGVVHALVDSMLVIKGDENSNPMDLGSVVCLEDKTVLGAIADTFGPVAAPFYVVYLPDEVPESRQKPNSSSAPSASSSASGLRARLSAGVRVYSDVSHSSFLLGQHGQVPGYLKSLHRVRLHYASGEEDFSEDDEDDDRMSCVSGVSSRSSASQRSMRGRRGRGLSALPSRKDGDKAAACLKETYEEAGKEISPEEEAALELQKQQKEQQQRLRSEAMLRQFSHARDDHKLAKSGCANKRAFAVPDPPRSRRDQGSAKEPEQRGEERRRSEGARRPHGGGEAREGSSKGSTERRSRTGPTSAHAQDPGIPPPPAFGSSAVRAGNRPPFAPPNSAAAHTHGSCGPPSPFGYPSRPAFSPPPPSPNHGPCSQEAGNVSCAPGAFPHGAAASASHMHQTHAPPHLHTGCCPTYQATGGSLGSSVANAPSQCMPSFSNCVHACACTQTQAPGGDACSFHGAPTLSGSPTALTSPSHGMGCAGQAPAGSAPSFCPTPFPHPAPAAPGFANAFSHSHGGGCPGAAGPGPAPGVSTPEHGGGAVPAQFAQPHAWSAPQALASAANCFHHSEQREQREASHAVASLPPWARTCQPCSPTSGVYPPHSVSHPLQTPSNPSFPAGQGVRPPPPPPFR